MAVKKVGSFNIHETPAINQNEFDVETYLNANWEKTKEAVNNNAEELMQAQKDISTLKEDNKTNKSSIDVLEKSNETINKSLEDIDTKDKKQDEDIKANKESIEALQTENIEIKSENERLRNDIKSIAVVNEVSGENIHIEDSSDARCELDIGGNQKQETREGYNQIDIDDFFEGTRNGVTITKDLEKGSLTFNGTVTSTFAIAVPLSISKGTIVSYSLNNSKINKEVIMRFATATGTIGGLLCDAVDAKKENFELTEDINGVQIRIGAGITLDTFVIFPQLETNTSLHNFEIYGASPSIDYPSPVKSVGNIKNILDMRNAKGGTSGGITCNMIADGSYTYKGTASSKAINIWLLGSYNNKTPIFRLEPGTYYIDGVVLFDGNNVLANPDTAKIFTFINAHDITGVRALDAVLKNTYDETKYPIIAKIDHEIPWVPYDCGYAKVNIQNKNIAPIFNLGTNWKYTDKGIKNTITSAEKEITKFKLKAGQTIKIGFKLFSKPSQDTTFTWYVNNVSNIISSFGHIDRTTFELNKIYTRTYTAKEECVIRSKMFGNANNDIFEFQMWAEYDNLTEYKKYEEQSYLVDVQQPMLEGDKFVKIDEKWYEKHNFDVISTLNKSNIKVTKSSTSTDTFFRYLLSLNAVNRKEGIGLKIYSTHFINKNSRWARVEGICGWESGTTFCLGTFNAEYDTEEKVTNFLQNTDVKIYYELAEPILLECTEAQSKVLDEIYNKAHTYKNITNISAESAEVNPIINVKYLKDTETEHNKLQAQIDEIKELLSSTATSALLLDNIQKELESEV